MFEAKNDYSKLACTTKSLLEGELALKKSRVKFVWLCLLKKKKKNQRFKGIRVFRAYVKPVSQVNRKFLLVPVHTRCS